MDGLGADDLVGYRVGPYGFTVTPTGVPLLQIDSIGTDADKNAVVEIDAVTADVGGGVALCGVGSRLDGLTGGQAQNAQQDNGRNP